MRAYDARFIVGEAIAAAETGASDADEPAFTWNRDRQARGEVSA